MVEESVSRLLQKHCNFTLLSSKINIPYSQSCITNRTGIFGKLSEAADKKLVLIKAPAGYGKSTVASRWAELNKEIHSVAWISLDKSDNERIRFWSYFTYSLKNIYKQGLAGIFELLNSESLNVSEVFLSKLINEMAKIPSEIYIFLDDFHLIKDEEINKDMKFFIEYMPSNVHLIIVSRNSLIFPISKLRLSEELLEINVEELKFSYDETIAYFKEHTNLKLLNTDIREIEERTEGWISAIKIVALSLKDDANCLESIRSFGKGSYYLLMFIAEEIVDKQPYEIQEFLYKTSILNMLSSELCNAVIGVDNAQKTLEYLFHNQLFLIAYDNMVNFKYHRLFAAFLRHRLKDHYPELIYELHLKASGWYEQNGYQEEAIEHSIDSENYQKTIRLVESYTSEYICLGQYKKVIALVDKLPQPILQQSSRICISYALSKALVWQLYREDTTLLLKGIDLESDRYKEYAFELDLIKAAVALNVEDIRVSEVMKHLNAANRHKIPLNSLHAEVYLKFGYVCMINGDFINADKYYTKALKIARKFNTINIILNAMHTLGQIKFNNGFTANAIEFYSSAIKMIEENYEYSYSASNTVYLSAAYAHYELNDLVRTNLYVEKGIKLSETIQDNYGLLMGYVFRAMVLTAEKRYREAMDTIQMVDKYCTKPEFRFVMTQVIYYMISILIRVNKIDMAEELVYKYRLTFHDSTKYIHEEENMGLAKLHIALGKGEMALPIIDKMLEEARVTRRVWSISKILTIKAVVCKQLHRNELAISALREALKSTYSAGYLRTYIDYDKSIMPLLLELIEVEGANASNEKDEKVIEYGLKLLSFLSDHDNLEAESNSIINELKPRELQVLKYLYIGNSNQEIADKMYVSVSSVKKYVNSIYEKLCVKNRSQAITVIRELNIKI